MYKVTCGELCCWWVGEIGIQPLSPLVYLFIFTNLTSWEVIIHFEWIHFKCHPRIPNIKFLQVELVSTDACKAFQECQLGFSSFFKKI